VAPDILVWHRDDLRVRDNPALAAAAADGVAHPAFVFDPRFYRSDRVCDGRIEFLHESLEALAEAYRGRGGDLAYRHGDPRSILRELLDEGSVDRIYLNATTTSGYARDRDREIAGWDRVSVLEDDGIVRTGETREGWNEQAEAYFESERHDPPATVGDGVASTVTVDEIEAEYGIDSDKHRRHRGGCRRAGRRLETFTENIDAYVGGISPPAAAEKRTLEPLAVFRVRLSVAARGLPARRGGGGRWPFEGAFHHPAVLEPPLHAETRGQPRFDRARGEPRLSRDESRDPRADLVAAWKRGETGFPMVDASMRALRRTGWLNFRMRAMCATFYTYILRGWWKVGADWFYRHLIDADPAINYQQWQMQSGLVGVHPLRIYNPRKQVRENDPDGTFIKKYVPELAAFPTDYLDRPEKAPLSVQAGVRRRDRGGISVPGRRFRAASDGGAGGLERARRPGIGGAEGSRRPSPGVLHRESGPDRVRNRGRDAPASGRTDRPRRVRRLIAGETKGLFARATNGGCASVHPVRVSGRNGTEPHHGLADVSVLL